MPADHFFLMPLTRPGDGTGHLRRACTLASELAENGKQCQLVLNEPARWTIECTTLHSKVRIVPEKEFFARPPAQYDAEKTLILVDARSTSDKRLKQAAQYGCPVLLDDDGQARDIAPFLIDCIPGPRKGQSNQVDTAFLSLPVKQRKPDPDGLILVTFGGEDPAGLTAPVLQFLLNEMGIPAQRIVTTRDNGKVPNVAVLQAPGDLKNRLHDFGLVICSYGLTAFEALAAGSAVITVDPGAYHSRLSRYAGLPGAGYARHGSLSRRQCRRIKYFMSTPGILTESCDRMRKKWNLEAERRSLGHFLQNLENTCTGLHRLRLTSATNYCPF